MAEKLVKGVGAMIGLATEAHAARRSSKAARAAADNENTPESSSQQRMTPPPTTSTSRSRRASPSKPTGSSHVATDDEIEHEKKGNETNFEMDIPDQAPPPYSESTLEGHAGEKDEADWELDDAVED